MRAVHTVPSRNVSRRKDGRSRSRAPEPKRYADATMRRRGERDSPREPETPPPARRRRERRRISLDLREVVARALEIPGEIPRGRVTLLGQLREAPLDDPAERHGDPRRGRGEGLGLVPNDGRERLGPRRPVEGALAGEHLVEDDAERELVRAEIHRLAARLLRRHVAGGPHDRALASLLLRDGPVAAVGAVLLPLVDLGEAEVQDLGQAVAGDHHVLGLEVAVHDARLVRPRESVGELGRERDGALRRQRARVEHVSQGPAVDELHDDERRLVLAADLVDRDDAGMAESGCGPRLRLEAGQALGISRHLAREGLEGDVAPEARVARAVHLSHPARSEAVNDLVWPEPSSGGELHGAPMGQSRHQDYAWASARFRLCDEGRPRTDGRPLREDENRDFAAELPESHWQWSAADHSGRDRVSNSVDVLPSGTARASAVEVENSEFRGGHGGPEGRRVAQVHGLAERLPRAVPAVTQGTK